MAPTCGALFISFLKSSGLDIHLLPAALQSGRKACFYSGCSALALLQGNVNEVHLAFWPFVVERHYYWPFQNILDVFLFVRDGLKVHSAVSFVESHFTRFKLVDQCCCT